MVAKKNHVESIVFLGNSIVQYFCEQYTCTP